MCGITGIYSRRDPVDHGLVMAMTQMMFHRGPMEDGYLFQPHIKLGMRRLSIIDVEGGHQPVYSEDGSIGVILNGQIYNYRELRQNLLGRNHHLRTVSDTEVIVHLYEEMGEACLKLFNGMFAFALWDGRKDRLFIARDRLGIKPLYYFENFEYFAFASELKALLLCPFIPREPDPQAISDYLTFMYIRAPHSPFKSIFKLLPGHYLTVDSQGLKVTKYWDLRDHCQSSNLDEGEAIEQIRELIRDAVRLRLRSDVPVGAFLSGGLDSSTVVAFAAQQQQEPLNTFGVGFAGDGFDELSYARVVAEAFKTRHHETTVTVTDAIQNLPKLVWHLDEPNADSAFVPTYLVSEFAASQLRVILTGLGGDELFGGYPRYFDGYPLEHLYRRVPMSLRNLPVAPIVRHFSATVANRLELNGKADAARYLERVNVFPRSEKLGLMGAFVKDSADLQNEFAGYPGEDPINRMMYVDALTYLPDDILHITDRMSMAVSLEARTPFLDYRLVEFCAGLPGNLKVRQGHREWKVILKKALAPILPQEILTRKKWGFGAPVTAWMDQGLAQTVSQVYRDSFAVKIGLVDGTGVSRCISQYASQKRLSGSAQKLWSLLVLEVWCQVFLQQDSVVLPSFTLDDLGEK